MFEYPRGDSGILLCMHKNQQECICLCLLVYKNNNCDIIFMSVITTISITYILVDVHVCKSIHALLNSFLRAVKEKGGT